MPIKIILGSTSEQKRSALEQACELLDLEAKILQLPTLSGINEQPVGMDETLQGARNRAKSASVQEKFWDLAIGIESGIIRIKDGISFITFDVAAIVIITFDGKQIETTSSGIMLPEECVKTAEGCGFATTTVGSIVALKYGGDPTDPHSTVTKGKISRSMTLANALVIALKQA